MQEKLDLKEEVICGFNVSTKRKKVWQKEIDMTKMVIDICNKNNIKYSVSGGTLLGAIRHKGFIPWDDDIDIIMKREEYRKFIEIAKKEIKPPYFLQHYETEKGYYYGHAQIRNSDTTAIINGDENNSFNHGIFVDIFPLDNVPDDMDVRKNFLDKLAKKKRILASYYGIKTSSNVLKKAMKIIYWKLHNVDKEIRKFEKLAQKYNNDETEICGDVSFMPHGMLYKNEWLENSIDLEFHYIKVKGVKEYDSLLKKQYGDYMKIPENKNGTIHGGIFFDPDNSYTKYLNDMENIMQRLKNKEEIL